MGRRVPPAQAPDGRGEPAEPGPGPGPLPAPEAQARPTLSIGPILALTIRHFFPEFNDWIQRIHDPRFQPFVIYDSKFLFWWGLSLFLFKLGSRRQLDFQLNSDGPCVLENVNRLAGTDQQTRPVNQTLNYYLGRIGSPPVAGVRAEMVNRLVRMKALDEARLQGRFVTAVDGSGYLVFNYRHCDHCLTQRHGDKTVYMHQVLEAKILGPAELVISVATAFIDNRDRPEAGPGGEVSKQDCELKALGRLAPGLRQDFPQLPMCLSGDAEFACGAGFQVAKDQRMAYVYVLKAGRLPSVWEDFQALLPLCPEQRVEVDTPDGDRLVYRWVNGMSYEDSDGRSWTFTAIQYEGTLKNGDKQFWAWVTDLEVNHHTVVEVATKGGRQRWHIENQGFNTQKNSELNLEHAYCHGGQWEAYYYLLQIAHLLLQLVEKGSLLRKLAQEQGKRTAVHLYGSLKGMAQRLLESVRYSRWPDEAFDPQHARHIQIRFDSG